MTNDLTNKISNGICVLVTASIMMIAAFTAAVFVSDCNTDNSMDGQVSTFADPGMPDDVNSNIQLSQYDSLDQFFDEQVIIEAGKNGVLVFLYPAAVEWVLYNVDVNTHFLLQYTERNATLFYEPINEDSPFYHPSEADRLELHSELSGVFNYFFSKGVDTGKGLGICIVTHELVRLVGTPEKILVGLWCPCKPYIAYSCAIGEDFHTTFKSCDYDVKSTAFSETTPYLPHVL